MPGRKKATQYFTGRWAAKKAILKGLGTGWRKGISWRDIEMQQTQRKVVVAVRGGVKEVVERLGIARSTSVFPTATPTPRPRRLPWKKENKVRALKRRTSLMYFACLQVNNF